MLSMSLTNRSTIMGVLGFLTPLKSSVKVAFPLSIFSVGIIFLSASAASRASSNSCFKNSILVISPCSCFSFSFSTFSPSCRNFGSLLYFLIFAIKSISIFLAVFLTSVCLLMKLSMNSAFRVRISSYHHLNEFLQFRYYYESVP